MTAADEPAQAGVPAGGQAGGQGSGAPTLTAALEALLIVSDVPVGGAEAAAALGAPLADVEQALGHLRDRLEGERRGFRLRAGTGGWQLYAAPEHRQVVERFVRGEQSARLSPAALETLAVVAYRQPVTRSRVAAIRGVNVDAVLRTLMQRELVEPVGTDAATGAQLFRTTPHFLDRLGIASLDELPDLGPLLPDAESLSRGDVSPSI